MIGGSYNGTTANMVAARSATRPAWPGIVPIAAISRWYGYAYSQGVRYSGNSQRPTDEGADTPLAFDFGFGRTPPTDPRRSTRLAAASALRRRPPHREGLRHLARLRRLLARARLPQGRSPLRRPRADRHGWQDFNVKQEEGLGLFKALKASRTRSCTCSRTATARRRTPPSCRCSTRSSTACSRAGRRHQAMPAMLTQGRSDAGAGAGGRAETSWPPAGTERLASAARPRDAAGTLGATWRRPAASYTDASPARGVAARALGVEAEWLTYQTEPLSADIRIADAPVLDARITVDRDHGQLVPTLLDVDPAAARPDHARLPQPALPRRPGRRAPMPVGEAVPVARRRSATGLDRQAGHRVALVLESSNSAWAVPDSPGLSVAVASRTLEASCCPSRPGPGTDPAIQWAPWPTRKRSSRSSPRSEPRGARPEDPRPLGEHGGPISPRRASPHRPPVPDGGGAARAEEELTDLGCDVVGFEAAGGRSSGRSARPASCWSTAPTSPASATASELAARHSGEFDGWAAAADSLRARLGYCAAGCRSGSTFSFFSSPLGGNSAWRPRSRKPRRRRKRAHKEE